MANKNSTGFNLRPIYLFLTILAVIATFAVDQRTALSSPVNANLDYFATQPSSYKDFSGTPIPPDFFAPGSDPFQGTVYFLGEPLSPVSNYDTVVERLESARFPHPFSSNDTIPIEIIALSLVSVNPITVTYNGGSNPELWRINVTLSQAPQTAGNMTITHIDNDDGVNADQ